MNPAKALKREKDIPKKCNQAIKKALEVSLCLGVTCGAVFLLGLPGGQLPGMILLSISIAMITKRYGEGIKNYVEKRKERKERNDADPLNYAPGRMRFG